MLNTCLVYRSYGLPAKCLNLENRELPPVAEGHLRVAVSYAPVNPSDLIPITGAYPHRIQLPSIAGYEAVGTVIAAPQEYSALVGRRVLPVRGAGTWQKYIDCDPRVAVPVPDFIPDLVAARSYINPLASLMMLDQWQVKGRHVLLCGAGSTCADILGRWALQHGATTVSGIYRTESRVPGLLGHGIEPISVNDTQAVIGAARHADIAFDSVGGPAGNAVLDAMRPETVFVGYGLLSGKSVSVSQNAQARYRRFHLRDYISKMSEAAWQDNFLRIWPALARHDWPETDTFKMSDWKCAINQTLRQGAPKPLLYFGHG